MEEKGVSSINLCEYIVDRGSLKCIWHCSRVNLENRYTGANKMQFYPNTLQSGQHKTSSSLDSQNERNHRKSNRGGVFSQTGCGLLFCIVSDLQVML